MGIFRNRPVASADNPLDAAPGRGGTYGERYTLPVGLGRYNIADEGSYFTCVNATLATAIAGHVAPAIADTDTKPLLHLFNAGPRSVYIDYVKLAHISANASSTSSDFLVYLDNKGATARSSGGTAITPNNVRTDANLTTGATVHFGAVVAAPSSSKKVAQWTVRPVIGVAEDQYLFAFGSGLVPYATGVITGTTVNMVAVSMPPVVIGPGGNFMFSAVGPSGAVTAATYEFEFGYWDR